MIVVIILAAIFFILGIIVLIGKGDNLIAGYNTTSEEESMATPFSFIDKMNPGQTLIETPAPE